MNFNENIKIFTFTITFLHVLLTVGDTEGFFVIIYFWGAIVFNNIFYYGLNLK